MELLPCPFCGSMRSTAMETEFGPAFRGYENALVWSVVCMNCHAEGPATPIDAADAEAKWNSRTFIAAERPALYEVKTTLP
jgi:hypothetical protein